MESEEVILRGNRNSDSLKRRNQKAMSRKSRDSGLSSKRQSYVRESLRIQGYRGIGGKINLFETRKNNLWRSSREDILDTPLKTVVKVKDLVNQFELKPQSPYKQALISKPTSRVSPLYPKTPGIRTSVSEGKNSKSLESLIHQEKKTEQHATGITEILKATVKIYSGNAPETPLRISHSPIRHDRKRQTSEDTSGTSSCATVEQNNNKKGDEREKHHSQISLSHQINPIEVSHEESLGIENRISKLIDEQEITRTISLEGLKTSEEGEELIPPPINFSQEIEWTENEVDDSGTSRQENISDDKNNTGVIIPTKGVEKYENDNQIELTRRTIESGSEQIILRLNSCEREKKRNADSGSTVRDCDSRNDLNCFNNLSGHKPASQRDNCENTKVILREGLRHNNMPNREYSYVPDVVSQTNKVSTDTNLEGGLIWNYQEEYDIDEFVRRSIALDIDILDNDNEYCRSRDSLDMGLQEERHDKFRQSNEAGVTNSMKPELRKGSVQRALLRRNAIRVRKSESLGVCIKTMKLLEEQELYQTYSALEESALRNSIMLHGEKQELGYYLLHRNGSTSSIQQLKTIQHRPLTLTSISGPGIFLWRNLPGVVSSGRFKGLTNEQLGCQEALFEIISSQASYVKSLGVIENYFMVEISHRANGIIEKKDYSKLFFHIQPFFGIEKHLINKMVDLFNNDIMMVHLVDIVKEHYREHRNIILRYGRNQEEKLHQFEELEKSNPKFKHLINDLSNNKAAGFLPFASYLNLPMQRVTKLPMLLKTVLAYLEKDSTLYSQYTSALQIVEQIAEGMNKEIEKMQKWEEMLNLDQELNFAGTDLRRHFFSSYRYMVLRSHGRKVSGRKTKVELLLFNDLFVVVKKMPGRRYKNLRVCDYSVRSSLKINSYTRLNYSDQEPIEFNFISEKDGILKSELFVFNETSDRLRWVKALSPRPKNFYGHVVIQRRQKKVELDDLDLEIGDIVGVAHDGGNGLSFGCKLKDNSWGWFSVSNSQFISSKFISKTHQDSRSSYIADVSEGMSHA